MSQPVYRLLHGLAAVLMTSIGGYVITNQSQIVALIPPKYQPIAVMVFGALVAVGVGQHAIGRDQTGNKLAPPQ